VPDVPPKRRLVDELTEKEAQAPSAADNHGAEEAWSNKGADVLVDAAEVQQIPPAIEIKRPVCTSWIPQGSSDPQGDWLWHETLYNADENLSRELSKCWSRPAAESAKGWRVAAKIVGQDVVLVVGHLLSLREIDSGLCVVRALSGSYSPVSFHG
jgi:hypothetical protein